MEAAVVIDGDRHLRLAVEPTYLVRSASPLMERA
jgi:hypothetical protein